MSDPKTIATELKSALSVLYKVRTRQVPGVLGDGTTAQRMFVDGAPQRVWFRPDPYPNALWQPIFLTADVPALYGMAVVVEFDDSDGEWYVVQTDRKKYAEQESFSLRYVPAHAADQHIINEDTVPSDPIWVYRRAIPMLRGSPPDDGTLRVYIQPGDLPFVDEAWWAGGYSGDLTSLLPTTGNQVWVTVYIEDDLTVTSTAGTEHVPALGVLYPPPSPPNATVPICYVLLQDDSATTTEGMIYDARRLIGAVGSGMTLVHDHSGSTQGGTTLGPALITMTGPIDMDGNRIVIDEDGDTYIQQGPSDDQIYITVGGSVMGAWRTDGLVLGYLSAVKLVGQPDALVLDLDEDTTISAPTDDQIDIEIGGADQIVLSLTEMAFNEQGNDIDFRVEGDTETHLLFVDAGNDRVGIAESAPEHPLHVYSDSDQFILQLDTDGAVGSCIATFVAYNNSSSGAGGGFLGRAARGTRASPANVQAGDRLGFNIFGGYAGSAFRNVAGIEGRVGAGTISGTSLPAYIKFLTTPDGSVARVERLRIDQDGNVGIGTSSPGSLLELNLATENLEIVDAGSAAATEQDWVEVQVGGVTGYLRVYASK